MRNLLTLTLLFLTSCSITESAKNAAKEWWEENKQIVVNGTANAAKNYWDENKGQLLDSAKNYATQVGVEAVKQANSYTDEKITEQKNKAVENLLKNGVKFGDLDTDGNGTITDDELAAYMKANPMAFWYAGGAGIAFYAMWLLRQAVRAKLGGTPQPAPATPPSA